MSLPKKSRSRLHTTNSSWLSLHQVSGQSRLLPTLQNFTFTSLVASFKWWWIGASKRLPQALMAGVFSSLVLFLITSRYPHEVANVLFASSYAPLIISIFLAQWYGISFLTGQSRGGLVTSTIITLWLYTRLQWLITPLWWWWTGLLGYWGGEFLIKKLWAHRL